MNKIERLCLVLILWVITLTNCSRKETVYKIPNENDAQPSMLTPVATSKSEDYEYENEGNVQKVIVSFSSDDGLCLIKRFPSYYDVTLDYEKGSIEEINKLC